jgi:hypothetical protein
LARFPVPVLVPVFFCMSSPVHHLTRRKTRYIPLNSLGENPLQQECTLTVDIRVPTIKVSLSNLQELADVSLDSVYPNRMLQVVAEGLKTPGEGDVEFIAKSEDGKEGRLYASSRVLSSTSDYFKTSPILSSPFSD